MMPLQRVRICWEPGEKQVVKWTAEGAVKWNSDYYWWYLDISEYSATLKAGVICRGYVSILIRARDSREFKVVPRIVYIRPWQKVFSVKDFLLYRKLRSYTTKNAPRGCARFCIWKMSHKRRKSGARVSRAKLFLRYKELRFCCIEI